MACCIACFCHLSAPQVVLYEDCLLFKYIDWHENQTYSTRKIFVLINQSKWIDKLKVYLKWVTRDKTTHIRNSVGFAIFNGFELKSFISTINFHTKGSANGKDLIHFKKWRNVFFVRYRLKLKKLSYKSGYMVFDEKIGQRFGILCLACFNTFDWLE